MSDQKPILLIRADAGPMIGHGHVMRMIAVAQGWQKLGGTVVFAGIECPDTLIGRVEKEGCRWIQLSIVKIGSADDARQCHQLAIRLECRAILLDGYHFGVDYISVLKENASGSVGIVVDSMPPESLIRKADYIFYPCLVSEKTECSGVENLHMGPDFILLRQEFLDAAETIKSRSSRNTGILKLLLCLGGSDPDNITSVIMDALAAEAEKLNACLDLRVIAGGSNLLCDVLSEKCAVLNQHFSCQFYKDATEIVRHYLWADMVITAAGGMVWEWLYLGIPGAVVAIAENQRESYQVLTRLPGIKGLYCFSEKKSSRGLRLNLRDWINCELEKETDRPNLGSDFGQGIERVAKTILRSL